MSEQLSTSFTNPLPKDGKDYSPSNLTERDQMRIRSTTMSLHRISGTGLADIKPEDAWVHGTNVKTALKYNPTETRAALVLMVGDVCKFIDAKKTLETAADFIFCVEALLDQFPAMKLEEWRIVTQRMKMGYYGKYYERLKVAEFADAFVAHETERQPFIEKQHTAHQITRGTDRPDHVTYEPQSMADLRRKAWPFRYDNTTKPEPDATEPEPETNA